MFPALTLTFGNRAPSLRPTRGGLPPAPRSHFKHLHFMAQAIMDPEEVRRFAKELKRFNDDVQVRAQSLQARFAALGSTW